MIARKLHVPQNSREYQHAIAFIAKHAARQCLPHCRMSCALRSRAPLLGERTAAGCCDRRRTLARPKRKGRAADAEQARQESQAAKTAMRAADDALHAHLCGTQPRPRVRQQKASAKVRRGPASAAGSTSRVHMRLPPRFDAASVYAATITRTSTQACAAPGCVRMARGSAACGAAHVLATATPHRCVEAVHSVTTTVCAAKVSRFGAPVRERAALLPALLSMRTLSRCAMASFTACTTYPASQCHLSHLQHRLRVPKGAA